MKKFLYIIAAILPLSYVFTVHGVWYGTHAQAFSNGTTTSCSPDSSSVGGYAPGYTVDYAVTNSLFSTVPNPTLNNYALNSNQTNAVVSPTSGTMYCLYWDGAAPACGSWTPNPPPWSNTFNTFTLAGSTDAGGSGISTAGGTCNTASVNGATCTVTISDSAGNTTSCTSPAARIDKILPSSGNVTFSNGWNKWYNAAQTVSFSVSDSGGSHLNNIYLQESVSSVDNNGTLLGWGSWTSVTTGAGGGLDSYSSTYTVPFANKTAHKFRIYATDVAGNAYTSVEFGSIYMENEIPNGGSLTYANGWTNSLKTITYGGMGDTGGSKLNRIELQESSTAINSGDNVGGTAAGWSAYATVDSIASNINSNTSTSRNWTRNLANGYAYRYKVVAYDNAGNQYAITSANSIWFESTAPTPVFSFDLSGLTTSGQLKVIAVCHDLGGSLCDKTYNPYSWTVTDNAGIITYSKICAGMDINDLRSVSNSSTCAGPLALKDKAGNINNSITYTINGGGNDLSTLLGSNTKITGATQLNSDNTAAAINSDSRLNGNPVEDNFSRISKANIALTVNKNITRLLAGFDRSPQIAGTANITSFASFSNNEGSVMNINGKKLVYFKDKDVTINCASYCSISGNITIIIERGNLKINSDMVYANDASILGIVLIGNKDGTKSQVKISQNITNGAGVIYTDGSIISAIPGTWANIYDTSSNSVGLNQLYWKGSFISQNSLGGSIGTYSCPYGTYGYINANQCDSELEARRYDLLFLRKYKLINGTSYYGITSAVSPFTATSVPLGMDSSTLVNPIKLTGGRGYYKNGTQVVVGAASVLPASSQHDEFLSNGFILDYDSKIQTNPPITFEDK